MKYLQKTFTLPSGGSKLSDDDYELAVGKISQAEYEKRKKARVKQPAKSKRQ